MCIHSEKYRNLYDRRQEEETRTKRTVSLRNSAGRLIAAWPVKFANTQMVANTIRDIKAWHPGHENVWVDLSEVNMARSKAGLETLDNEGLPFPVGEALPQDMDVDLVMRGKNDFTEFERGLQRYAQAQKKQLEEHMLVAVGA